MKSLYKLLDIKISEHVEAEELRFANLDRAF